jgi:hypothetical protein
MRAWTVLIVFGLVVALLLAGCDNVLNDDGNTSDPGDDSGDSTDPVAAEDGSLTASVAGVPMDLESTSEGDEDLLFAAFVFEAGADVLSDSWEESWVALVAEEIVDGSASGTAFQIVDGARGEEWVGTAGESYDVYYTVYRVTLQDDGPPLKGGAHFMERNPECICGTVDWRSPVTYEQDGDHTLTSRFEQFLETSQVQCIAQGVLGLIGFVTDGSRLSDAFGDAPEVGATHVFTDADENDLGITGTLTQFEVADEALGIIHAGLRLDIEDSVLPAMEAPAPTATGTLTLAIVSQDNVGLQEVGFDTSNLIVTLSEDVSVEVELDGTASDFSQDTGEPATFTGSFACDGAEHDLSILSEMYDILPEPQEVPVEEPQ